MDAWEIKMISSSKKRTPTVSYVKGDTSRMKFPGCVKVFKCEEFAIIFGDGFQGCSRSIYGVSGGVFQMGESVFMMGLCEKNTLYIV